MFLPWISLNIAFPDQVVIGVDGFRCYKHDPALSASLVFIRALDIEIKSEELLHFSLDANRLMITSRCLSIANAAGRVIRSLMESLLELEAVIRLSAFLGMFGVMALWEVIAPRRELVRPKGERWVVNILMTAINTALVRFAVPAVAVSAALMAESRQWGLFHQLSLSPILTILACVIILDFLIYLQHLLFHRIPILWRLHRVHHTDLDFDVTTALRFHPIEIVLSLFIKAGAVIALGAPMEAIVLFEVLLNATAMFNHGNVRIPGGMDAVLRFVVVTPDMHRVHHSIRANETNSNFGFNLSCWDRIFGTYRAQPEDGHDDMTIGLKEFREPVDLALPFLLVQPFRNFGLK